MTRPSLLTLFALVVAVGAAAQAPPHLSVGVAVTGIRSVARDAGGRQVSTGLALGGTFTMHAGVFSLSTEYGEGSLRAAGASNERSLVEGGATAAIQLHPWVAVTSTFTAHQVTESEPERWLTWGTGARLEVPILGREVIGSAEFRQALGGDVNYPNGGVHAQEGIVGLQFALPSSPFWVALSSKLGSYTAGGRTRALEHFGISAGWHGL